jgi:hypothetical protein
MIDNPTATLTRGPWWRRPRILASNSTPASPAAKRP